MESRPNFQTGISQGVSIIKSLPLNPGSDEGIPRLYVHSWVRGSPIEKRGSLERGKSFPIQASNVGAAKPLTSSFEVVASSPKVCTRTNLII